MEVGKKYTHSCGFIFTCESITKLGNVVVSWDGDGGRKNEAVVREEDFKRYTEYKELQRSRSAFRAAQRKSR